MTDLRGESIRVVHPLFQEERGGSIPTSPLQFHIGRITYKVADSLVSTWHSTLPKVPKPETHFPCYGAEFEGRYFAAAMWGQPIAANRLKDGFKRLELRRFAIAPDAPKNTASRMIAIMVTMIKKEFPACIGLLSYQDVAAHTGCIYKASGWKNCAISKNTSWLRVDRKSTDEFVQSSAAKIRWELDL